MNCINTLKKKVIAYKKCCPIDEQHFSNKTNQNLTPEIIQILIDGFVRKGLRKKKSPIEERGFVV